MANEFHGDYFSRGGAFSKKDAVILGTALQGLTEKRGVAPTKYDLVDEARSSTSPFHPYFEWKDATAGEYYRLGQAEHILRDIGVVRVEGGITRELPVLIRDPTNRAKHVAPSGTVTTASRYIPATTMLEQPDSQEAQLAATQRLLVGIAKRLKMLRTYFESRYKSAPALLMALDAFAEEVEAEKVSAKAA